MPAAISTACSAIATAPARSPCAASTSARATRQPIAVLRFWPASCSLAVGHLVGFVDAAVDEQCAGEERGGVARVGIDTERAEAGERGTQRRDRGVWVACDQLDHARVQLGLREAVPESELLQRLARGREHRARHVEAAAQRLEHGLAAVRRRFDRR